MEAPEENTLFRFKRRSDIRRQSDIQDWWMFTAHTSTGPADIYSTDNKTFIGLADIYRIDNQPFTGLTGIYAAFGQEQTIYLPT